MTHRKKRRWTPGKASALLRERRTARRLLSESLEQRILLTAVVSVSPPANSHTASISTDLTATFDQTINGATATSETFAVHSMQRGQLIGAAATVSATGAAVTFNPTSDFFPGELIEASVQSAIQNTTSQPVDPHVWQLRTAVHSGSGQFINSGQSLGNQQSSGVALGDLDGDGDLDALVANADQGDRVWLNDGSGMLGDTGQVLGNDDARDVSLGDLDGDGDLDALIVNSEQGNRVWLNNGSGQLNGSGLSLGNGNSYGVALGDLDGDGDLDAFVANAFEDNRVWLNNGSGGLSDSGQSLGNSNSRDVSLGDLDGDGDLDAFVANNSQGNRVWLNNGSGFLSDSEQSLGNHPSYSVSLGDLDGDGDLDAFVANGYQRANRVWVNDGGLFSDSGQSLGNHASYSASLGDLDGDGDLDAYVANGTQDGNRVWLNDGGLFSDSGQSLEEGGAISLGDLDGDGDLDAFVGNVAANRVWFNQNLAPSVTLSVDTTTIPEAEGVATVTAMLSATHTQPVTVDLGFSGSATEPADYTASAAQITIPIGASSGSITITAVQDAVDDNDETVQVDITGIANGQESGVQQVTVTVLDDDEPPVPVVTLAVESIGAPINYEMSGDFPGSNPILAGMGLDLGPFTGAFALDSTGDPVVQTADISVTETSLGGTVVFPDSEFEVTAAETVQVTSFFPAASSVFGFDTHLDVTLLFGAIVDLTKPLPPLVSGTVDIAVVVPVLGRVGETGVVSALGAVPAASITIEEAGGIARFTARLSETTTVPVTVELGFGGTATNGTDYTASATQIVVPVGATTGTVTITGVDDAVIEGDESIVVDVAAVTNGNEDGVQQQTITIVDDDVPPSFVVTSVEATASAVRVEFNNELDTSDVNLYDTANLGLGLADVVVTGASSGAVTGSLVIEASAVTFIKSGDPLAADRYTVTLRSAADGFKDTSAALLDGNGDGTGGDDYQSNFTIAAAPAGSRTIGIPDFVRGPGQDVNLPADTTNGIPLTISDGAGVRNVHLLIDYDPALLSITAAKVGAEMPPASTVVLNYGIVPGLVLVTFSSPTDLPAGVSTFVNLQATVPATDPSGVYGKQGILDIHSVVVTSANDIERPVIADDALHLASYFADVSGNGRINASDAAQVARVAALLDSGFGATPLTDPGIVGDISGNGRINAVDASLVARSAALIDVPEIPPIPGGIRIAGGDIAVGPGLPGATALRLNQSSSPAADHDSTDNSDTGAPPTTAAPVPHPAVDSVMTGLGDRSLEDRKEELLLALESAVEELFAAL